MFVRLPSQREIHEIDYRTGNYYFKTELIDMNIIRENCKRDLPTLEGNWDNSQFWLDNLWEALYNPIWILRKEESKIGILKGHHRMRMFDALDADKVLCYVTDRKDLSIKKLPREVVRIIKLNRKNPNLGNCAGICPKCKQLAKFKKITRHKLFDVIMICTKCGSDDIYTYPGRL